jgi:hypothetical protein
MQWVDIWAQKLEVVGDHQVWAIARDAGAPFSGMALGLPANRRRLRPLRLQFQQALSAAPLIAGTLRRQPMRVGPHHTPIHTCLLKETLRYSTTPR